jgi:hypothetical protein
MLSNRLAGAIRSVVSTFIMEGFGASEDAPFARQKRLLKLYIK